MFILGPIRPNKKVAAHARIDTVAAFRERMNWFVVAIETVVSRFTFTFDEQDSD